MSKLFQAIKELWLDFCDFTNNVPVAARARKVEAALTTDEQRGRRTALVRAIHLAASLQDRLPRAHANSIEKSDARLTVELTFKDMHLLEPEIWDYTMSRGAIQLARPGTYQVIFSGGVGWQAQRKRKECIEGLETAGILNTMAMTPARIKDEQDRMKVVQRARERGYNMSVLIRGHLRIRERKQSRKLMVCKAVKITKEFVGGHISVFDRLAAAARASEQGTRVKG